MHRRHLLQISAGIPLASYALANSTTEAPDVTVKEVMDDVAEPMLHKGDLVLVDTAVTRFQGEGMYLYPAWGDPRAYQVSTRGEMLVFSMPGSTAVLWQQDMRGDASAMAGKIIAVSQAHALETADIKWSVLQVPALPVQPATT